MKRLILVLLTVTSLQSQASGYTLVSNDNLAAQHAWDHIGVSFAVNTFLYGAFHRAFKMTRRQALLFSLVGTFMLTTVYSLSNNQTNAGLGGDIGYNMIGAGLSAGTVIMFSF